MYEIFKLKETMSSITGYDWVPEKPNYVVCLIHGIGEHAGRYDRVGECFKEAGIALTSMDLRGHGFSAGKRGHTAPRTEIFNDINLLIEHAASKYPDIPIILYGHSMGGNIALDYRIRGLMRNKPVGYIITSPWILLERKIPGYLFSIVNLIGKIKPDFQIDSKLNRDVLGNKDVIEKQENKHFIHGKISAKTVIEGLQIGEALLKGTLEKVGNEELRPVLLMQGDADKICSPEGSRKLAQKENELCKYIEWKDLYHEIHNGGPTDDGAQVIETMIKWIKDF